MIKDDNQTRPKTIGIDRVLRLERILVDIGGKPMQIKTPQCTEIFTPMQSYIDWLTANHPQFRNPRNDKSLITQRAITDVLLAMALLIPQGKYCEDIGKTVIKTSVRKIAKIVGLDESSEYNRASIRGALQVLHDVLVYAYVPKRTISIIDKNGNIKKVIQEGWTKLSLVTIESQGSEAWKRYGVLTDHSTLLLTVPPEAYQGVTQILIKESMNKEILRWCTTVPKGRVFCQILTKNHKMEDDLIKECFGLEEKKAEAGFTGSEEKNTEAMQKAESIFMSHYASYKKKLREFFEYLETVGLIHWWTEPSAEDPSKCVFRWYRTDEKQSKDKESDKAEETSENKTAKGD